MAVEPPGVRVCQTWLRLLFREQGYLSKVVDGHLTEKVTKSSMSNLPNLPAETRSEIVQYRDDAGNEVVKVHRLLNRDGTLGGSGLPDPKVIVHEGIRYFTGGRCGCDVEAGRCPHISMVQGAPSIPLFSMLEERPKP